VKVVVIRLSVIMPHSFSSSEDGGSVLLQNAGNLYQTYKYRNRARL